MAQVDDFIKVANAAAPINSPRLTAETFGTDPDNCAAVEWVADHIVLKDTKPKEAPSARAWALLQFARDNDVEFWRIFGKFVTEQRKREQDREDDGRTIFEVIGRLEKAMKT